MSGDDPLRFLVIGGGPAAVKAATHAASLGADVTVVESWVGVWVETLMVHPSLVESLSDAAD